MKNILVVCTGNICRSPTGEYLLKKELGPDFNVISAGLGALVDNPAHEISQKIAMEHGVDMSAHRARQINLDILKWADLILVMENGHKRELLRRYPWLDGKVFRYGESHQVDIPDPYRRPEAAYVMAWNFISKLTPYWVEKIKQSEANH
ncbi:MAG: low molecular weight phosphotyrosine protein phosphatase [Fibrobacter sp.]|jgi:protein-tyrosine phosphatase|nr:low molecular weight phosphotyrosine protein phosphatase [Fibrobacter sp.]